MAVVRISPFLWFEDQAEEAARFYVSVFKDACMISVSHYGAGAPMPEGTAMVATFELHGQRVMAMNGGSHFRLDEAFSLFVECDDQAEIDRLWTALGEGGSYNVCGWLKDRFGLSWQINWSGLAELLTGDPARAQRVTAAMWGMTKTDIAGLKAAARG